MAASIDTIYMVEASPTLRETQRKLLCGDSAMEEHESGFTSTSKDLPGVKIVWTEDITFKASGPYPHHQQIPQHPNTTTEQSKTPFIIAHEFFDALPIHAFQSTKPPPPLSPQQPRGITTSTLPTPLPPLRAPRNEWRELVVSPTPPPSIISPPKTPALEFQLTPSQKPTPHSRLLPSLSPRYAALLATDGATIEICPSARTITEHLARLIGGGPAAQAGAPAKSQPSGAALFVDYGPAETIPTNTLRGIRAHRVCSPFEAPGRVDLSADVDFGALVEAALDASEGVEVHGPVEQAHWLGAMGGKERTDVLIRKARADGGGGAEEVADRISTGWRRLVDRGPNGMGKVYKVMAVVPAAAGARRPVGFGGDVYA